MTYALDMCISKVFRHIRSMTQINLRQQTQLLFDTLSSKYDDNSNANRFYDAPVERFLLDHIQPGMRILDVGCGTAPFTRNLTSSVDVVGIDVSPSMLEIAKLHRPSGVFVEHDCRQPLPASLGVFDIIISSSCLEFVEEIETVLDHLSHSLAKTGIMFFTVAERRSGVLFHDQRTQIIPSKLAVGQQIYARFWSFSELASILEKLHLTPRQYEYGPGWRLNTDGTPVIIYYGYWITMRG